MMYFILTRIKDITLFITIDYLKVRIQYHPPPSYVGFESRRRIIIYFKGSDFTIFMNIILKQYKIILREKKSDEQSSVPCLIAASRIATKVK